MASGIIDRSHMFHRLRVSGDRLCTLIDEKFKNSAVTAHVELVTRVPEQTIGRRAAPRSCFSVFPSNKMCARRRLESFGRCTVCALVIVSR